MAVTTRTDALAAVEDKVLAGERLDAADGLALLRSPDLLRVGRLADAVRRRVVAASPAVASGEATVDDAYFINNRHINHTNICKNRCDFCAFSRDEGEEGAYLMTLDEVLAKARASPAEGVTEFHIVGGEHPGLSYDAIREMIAGLHEACPGVVLTAFTASEIVHFAQMSRMSEEDVLLDLKAAGLGALPGGGAEVFARRVREMVCAKKISGEKWLEIHMLAHRLGLPTNATMLYGHRETLEERVDHLLRLREAQDETGGFAAFIPLAFHPRNTKLADLSPTTGVDDLKMLAVARLMLDNFPHIKAYWVMIGLKLAQVSLYFGVDDLDGTIVEETITKAAGSEAGQAVARNELVRLIRDTGRLPVERDTFYRAVRRYDA
ncbi:MAG: aminofutalosine synthase MqnE [Thermoleophilia bacterium]|nr:aminofutalosine synthase MqnE [Thermoleophilia bacterium]